MTTLVDFQNLLVGFIGFAGVILTLLFNAWQTRSQLREERRHERTTLRAALIAELRINREAFDRNLEKIGEDDNQPGCFVPTGPMDDVYHSFKDRIGLLSEAEVGKVMNAYLALRTLDAKLYLIGVPPHTGDRHVHVPAKNYPILTGMSERMIELIDEAIQIMETARHAS